MLQNVRHDSDLDYPGNETIPLFCIRVMQIFIKPGILYRFLLLALAFFLSLALDIQCKQIFDLWHSKSMFLYYFFFCLIFIFIFFCWKFTTYEKSKQTNFTFILSYALIIWTTTMLG